MSELQNTLNEIKRQKDLYLLPENIKKDLTILGITGTLEGGTSGDGDVKLFSSIAEMNTSTGSEEGDLAIVYTSTQANLTADAVFQVATFPETVTLPSAISSYIEVGFVPVESTGSMFDCWGSLDSSRFNLDVHTDNGTIRIQYTSSNGIDYTRTTFQKNHETVSGDEMDFDVVIKFGSRWSEATWNDVIGYFMVVGSSDFEGLYQYGNNSYSFAKTQFNANTEKVYEGVFYGANGVMQGTLQNTTNLTTSQILTKTTIYDSLSYLELNDNITNLRNLFSSKRTISNIPNINTSNVTDMSYMFSHCENITSVPNFNTINVTNMSSMFQACYNLTSVPNFNTSNATNISYMFSGCNNLTSVPNFDTSNVSDIREMFSGCSNLTSVSNFDTSNVVSVFHTFYNCTNLVDVPEFNMSKVTHAYDLFYGCNNLSSNSYANIANSLPLASKLGNQYVSSLGLNIENFTTEQKQILGNKQYIDAISYIINTSNVSSYWNIYYYV